MNKVSGIDDDALLRTADLAARGEFRLGEALVNPGTRTIQGPGGEADLEPRVMQVLVVLADAAGSVVTRKALFQRCWGNVYVGDDSLNRAVAGVRKAAEKIAAGSFAVETVPRTGYQLVVKSGADPARERAEVIATGPSTTRRAIIGGAAAAAAATGTVAWFWLRDRPDPRFEALMQRGEDALRLDERGAEKYFRQAAQIEPRNARAWGLLAYALGNNQFDGAGMVTGPDAQAAERAARKALEINPNEPNALLAMTVVQRGMMDWFSREESYRRILTIDPDNMLVMRNLGLILHGVGRCRESLAVAERAIAIEPLCPDHQARTAGRLWVLGRVPEADRVIDRAMQLWPFHRIVRLMRLMIYAYTGREHAALAMVEDEKTSPHLLSPSAASVWRTSLVALENPTPSAITAARKANLEGSKATPAIASQAILTFSALGELDAAFDVANGFLLGRGSIIVRPRPEPKVPVNGPGWRNTYGLFTPPTKAMRLDPRFNPMAVGLGLTDYWRKRGIGPDAFLFKA